MMYSVIKTGIICITIIVCLWILMNGGKGDKQ